MLRNIFFFVAAFGIYLTCYGQASCKKTYKGLVVLNSDKGNGVANIGIIIDGTQGSDTDNNGVFSYTLNKCPGYTVNVRISNKNYGIVNHDDMAYHTIRHLDNLNDFQFKIIVSLNTNNQLENARIVYYSAIAGVSLDKAIASLQKRIIDLEKQLAVTKAVANKDREILIDSLANLQSRYNALLEVKKSPNGELQNIARIFAQQTEIDSNYHKAFSLYKNGMFQEALQILSGSKLDEEEKQIQATLDLGKLITESGEKRRSNLISKYLFKYIIYYNIGEFNNAESMLRRAVKFDSTNIDNIKYLAQFLQLQNRSTEPEIWYKKALKLETLDFEKAKILNNLGKYCHDNYRMDDAKKYYLQAQKILETSDERKNNNSYDLELADIFNKIGLLYKGSNWPDSAKIYYKRSEYIYEYIFEKSPSYLDDYAFQYANTLTNLGVINKILSNRDSALYYYNSAIYIYKQLAKNDPE